MTGESLPVNFTRGDLCKMGSTVVRGEVRFLRIIFFFLLLFFFFFFCLLILPFDSASLRVSSL